MSFARWLNARLAVTDTKGRSWPAGGGVGRHWKQKDDTRFALISQGDTFDVFLGRDQMYNVTLTAQTAKEAAWWLIKWWVFTCWFGLKLRLWDWTLGRMLDEQVEQAPTSSGNLERAPWD